MPLQKNILVSRYQSFFERVHQDNKAVPVRDCVDIWLDTYDQYVRTGQDPSGDSVAMVNLPAAKSILISGFSSNNGNQAIKDALSAYWSSAMFRTAIPHATMSQEITSTVVSFNTGALNKIFSNQFDSSTDSAKFIANELDSFTRTVQILITGLAKTGSPPPTITATGNLS